jgi:hypothetical protein
LGTRDIRLSDLLVKAIQIIEYESAVDFHFDVAGRAEAAVVGQTDLLVDSEVEF